jgi:hypothetical protein
MRIRIQNTAGIRIIFSLLKELVLTMFLFLFHMFGGHGLHVTPVPVGVKLSKKWLLTMFLFLFHVFGSHGLNVTPVPAVI